MRCSPFTCWSTCNEKAQPHHLCARWNTWVQTSLAISLLSLPSRPPGGSVGIAGGNKSEIIFTDDAGKVHSQILSRDQIILCIQLLILTSLSVKALRCTSWAVHGPQTESNPSRSTLLHSSLPLRTCLVKISRSTAHVRRRSCALECDCSAHPDSRAPSNFTLHPMKYCNVAKPAHNINTYADCALPQRMNLYEQKNQEYKHIYHFADIREVMRVLYWARFVL